MSRQGWTTIGIPTTLYNEIKKHRVPSHSKSVNSYAHFWIKVGCMIDSAFDGTDDAPNIIDRVLQAAVKIDERKED